MSHATIFLDREPGCRAIRDQRGVADRFLAEGKTAQASMLGATVLDMSDFPTRHPYSLGIWQNAIERIMAAWVAELEVQIYYGSAVTGFTQDEEGVEVEVTMGEPPEGTRHDAIGIRYEGECELPVLGRSLHLPRYWFGPTATCVGSMTVTTLVSPTR